jgi:hypothetical protein
MLIARFCHTGSNKKTRSIMKKLLILSLTCAYLNAGILDVAPNTIFKTPQTFQETGIGFELVNKSKRPIWIVLRAGGDTSRVAKVEPRSTMTTHFVRYSLKNLNQEAQLAVWYSDPGQVTYEKRFGIVGKEQFKPTPNTIYSFSPGKTLYLTWDEANYLRPQTGPLKGILKKTDSNLSLQANVKKEDIKEQAQIPAAA